MKKCKYISLKGILFVTILSFTLFSCEKNIFGANEGTLQGVVKDNNGTIIESAKITAAYTDGSETGSVSTSSDDDGYYNLDKIRLDENEITVESDGFESDVRTIFLEQDENEATLNFTLNGAPFLSGFTLSNNILDTTSGSSDSIAIFTVNVKDNYNSNALTNYVVNAIIYNSSSQSISQIIKLDAVSNTTSLFILETEINASDLDVGSFNISIEITDPDGNSITLENITSLDVI